MKLLYKWERCFVTLGTLVSIVSAQVGPVKGPATTSFVSPEVLPSNVRQYLVTLGDRIQKSGKERLTLTGTVTDTKYGTSGATMVWEAPGRVRLDRNAAGAPPLIVDNNIGSLVSTALDQSDLGVVESLLNDNAEAFLYGFIQRDAHRFLGGRFRTDGGKTPNYAGPWYNIFETVTPPKGRGIAPQRQKFFVFDSTSKLLEKTIYVVMQGNAKVSVSTEFSKWTSSQGQSTPGQIVRKENGVPVFTFAINAASVGPAANNGLFPGF